MSDSYRTHSTELIRAVALLADFQSSRIEFQVVVKICRFYFSLYIIIYFLLHAKVARRNWLKFEIMIAYNHPD